MCVFVYQGHRYVFRFAAPNAFFEDKEIFKEFKYNKESGDLLVDQVKRVFLCENRDRKRGCLSHCLILAWDCVGKRSLNSETTKQVRFSREAAGMHTCTCIHERTHYTQICTHTYPNEYLCTYTHTKVKHNVTCTCIRIHTSSMYE